VSFWTIGDDNFQIINKARADGKIPDGTYVFHANTPSYVGSHVTGYSSMVKAMVDYFAEKNDKKTKTVNLVPGFVEPSDMAEIKRITSEMGLRAITFPDTSEVLNGPLTGKYRMFPEGGVTVEQLKQSGDSLGTIGLGRAATLAAARALDVKCRVHGEVLDLPIGLEATDRYVDTLHRMAGVNVPDAITFERGQLVDVISDMHQYFYGKTVALAGDPDQLMALAKFLVSVDLHPRYMVTGTPAGKKFEKALRGVVKDVPFEVKIQIPGDLFLLHQWIKNEKVDILMGNTYLKYIAKDEDIPLVRHGFPILDRVGHSYFPTVGYRGAIRLLEKILDALLDRKDRDASDIDMELVM
jgi:nitrogenase molybdenum-iron protein beta chain